MIRILLIFLACAVPAAAETARVLSGEHGDFTRLVIELPKAQGWTVGRTSRGYAFAALGEMQPEYDFSDVWQRIAKTRLRSIRVDPETGTLDIELGCDCHIFPFEYRPGAVVLDIKPGPPPIASAFEAEFAPAEQKATALQAGATTKGYVWLEDSHEPNVEHSAESLTLPLDTGAVSLDPLRDELLEQISRGAADGIVDMELPGKPRDVAASDHEDLPWSRIRIGDQPGVAVLDPDSFKEAALPMSDCAAVEHVDLASWARAEPAHDLLAQARSGLFGEFDAPDTEAVLRSVKLHLYLGFGAEARQHADFLDDPSVIEELALYRSIARILDGESDPRTPFATMLECDSPAALWAALVRDRLPAGRGVNRDAVLQAFLALPPHLRHHLGPGLAEKFLGLGDADAARLIRDTIERTPDAPLAEIALLDASAALLDGDVDAAQAHAERALSLDGDSPDGLVALVEAHFTKLEPINPKVAEALVALQAETEGTHGAEGIKRALVLALALSGQTDAAFVQDSPKGDVNADLWRVVQDRATDDDFLRHAVLSASDTRPDVSPQVALGVALRLLELGFAEASLVWIGPVTAIDAPERRLATAMAMLESGNARSALGYLDGLNDPEGLALRAKALVQLGELPAASHALTAAGNGAEAARLGLWSGNWSSLDPKTPETWLKAAHHAGSAEATSDSGLLAKGTRTAEESLAARNAIETLLASVPSPSDD
jgi:hypothetical protein